ncbi:MAG: hypothetical protein ACYCS1_10320 [Gammaproteobacteria bacterium]
MCTKAVNLITMTIALAVLTLGVTQANAAMRQPAKTMVKPYRYFMRHSFGFPSIFYRYHPGPHWDLKHARALHLTAAQIREEKTMAMSMMHATMKGIMALRVAYRKYREDARRPNPSIKTLVQDVRGIGSAQSYLGYEVIPFHLKGYRLLDSSQRTVYRHLARENWRQMTHHR